LLLVKHRTYLFSIGKATSFAFIVLEFNFFLLYSATSPMQMYL